MGELNFPHNTLKGDAMYRKYIIKDVEGHEEEFDVFPREDSKIVVIKSNINLTLSARDALNNFIKGSSKLMDSNTIDRVEITELEET